MDWYAEDVCNGDLGYEDSEILTVEALEARHNSSIFLFLLKSLFDCIC